jgi:hypothetical protein
MSSGGRTTASYVVRVVESGDDGGSRITVQNLRTGEMRTFEAWSAFVAFAEGAPKPGALK